MKWSIVAAKSKLSEIVKRAAREPQIIENRGEPIALILSLKKYEVMHRRIERPSSPMDRVLQVAKEVRKEIGRNVLNLPKREDRTVSRIGE